MTDLLGINRSKKRIAVLAFVGILFVCLFGQAVHVSADEALSNMVEGWPQMGEIGEESGMIMDADDCGIMYSLNRNTIRYPASTTKIMTALLVLENASLSDIVTMTGTGVQMAISGSTNAGTVEGEEFTVEQCLYMLLLKSANDIANQLAEHVAGSLDAFVSMMNDRAAKIGCTDTHFCNPSGMPDSEHYTTPEDLGLIMREALKNDTFVKIAQAEKVTIPPTNKNPESRVYTNHNALVVKDSGYYYEDCIAGKTGYTDAAWRTFVAAAERDGRTLICVLMKGPDKTDFVDAARLFDYGFDNFEKIEVPGGSVTLPAGKSIDETGDDTVALPDGRMHVNFYYNQLPVGSADMTETEYCTLRGLPLPEVESAVSDTVSGEAVGTEGPAGENGSVSEKKTSSGGWVPVLIILILLCAIATGGLLLYKDHKEQKRQAERRRKVMERRRAQEKLKNRDEDEDIDL